MASNHDCSGSLSVRLPILFYTNGYVKFKQKSKKKIRAQNPIYQRLPEIYWWCSKKATKWTMVNAGADKILRQMQKIN